MLHNADMSQLKQKYSLWFSEDQIRKFDIVYGRAFKRAHGRTNHSEVIKELMGFPLKPGQEPVTTDEDRLLLGELLPSPSEGNEFAKNGEMILARSGKHIRRGKPNN